MAQPPDLVPLALPPGMKNVGTGYSSKNRFFTGNLVRWRGGVLEPIGGWSARGTTALTGVGRAIEVWRDNGNNIWIAVGTEQGLFIQSFSGALYNITPTGFSGGYANAGFLGGYGSGEYGTGYGYGTSPPSDGTQQDATMWSFDTFGPYLVGVSSSDGKIYEWQLATGTPAAQITNSPTCTALIVTADHIIMALAANGDPRQVTWCDQSNNTLWTASNTNTAGSNELSTNGRLMCGKNISGGTLLFTDVDLWLATNIQNEEIYGFTKVGDGCGIISRGAAAALGSQAMWMGENQFYLYNGAVTEAVPCEVGDFVFNNINLVQKSKIVCLSNSLFNEVTWFYQSLGGAEIDSYVTYNYQDENWSTGNLVRLSGIDRGALSNPLMVGADGLIYQHELGLNWSGLVPFATSGTLEIGNGDDVATVLGLIPDEKTLGNVQASFVGKLYPNDPDPISYGPYSPAAKTDFMFSAREISVTYQATGPVAFRVGTPRLLVKASGKR
jgi:hypothetical protein